MRWLAVIFGVLILALATTALYLFTADLGHFRDEASGLLSDAFGREVNIDGPFSLRLGSTVRLRADDVSVANAPWADDPYLLEADSLAVTVALASVFRGPLRIDSAELSGAVIRLQETDDGRRNWSLPESPDHDARSPQPAPSEWPQLGTATFESVRIHVSAPALTGPTEIAIDTASLSAIDASFTCTMLASVNDVPLRIDSAARPAGRTDAADALDMRVDASLGEITLAVRAEVADLQSLALTSAELTLDGPDAAYLFGVLNLPRIATGPLSLEATLVPDPQRSSFTAAGRFGDNRLSGEGWFEDVGGTGGFDVRLRLAGPDLAVLGEPLDIDGLPSARFDVDGRVRSRATGIEFDDTTVTLGDTTVRSSGSVVKRDDGGADVSIDAQHTDLSGRLAMSTRTGLSPEGATFEVEFGGPSAAAVGRRFGRPGLPASAFVVTGRAVYDSAVVALERAQVEIGGQRLQVSGDVGVSASGQPVDVRVAVENVEPATWLGNDDGLASLLDPINGTGRLRRAGGELTLEALSVEAGTLSIRGGVGVTAGSNAAKLSFEVAGPDAASAASALGVQGVPAMPFVAGIAGVYAGEALELESSWLQLEEQRLEVTGRVGLGASAGQADLRFTANAVDLTPWRPPESELDPALFSLSGSGHLRLAENGLRIDALALSVADAAVEGSLETDLSRGGDSGHFDLHLSAPSAAGLQPSLKRFALANEPLALRATGSWQPNGWQLSAVDLRLAERGALRGRLAFTAGDRPFIAADLTAETLDFTPTAVADAAPASAPSDGRAIPATPLPLDGLSGVDADFALTVASLTSPFTAGGRLQLVGTLRQGRLELTELETEGKRGSVRAVLVATPDAGSYAYHLDLHGKNLYVAAAEESEAVLAERPSYDVAVKLDARGDDLRAIAATLDGRVYVEARAGTIVRRGGQLSTLVFQDLLTRTIETINPLVSQRDTVELNCFVMQLQLDGGTVRGDPLVALQTTDINLLARGLVDLSSEKLDLDILTRPRRGLGISLADVLNPFTKIGGSLAAPQIVADPKSAVFETGAGIVTGGLWPLGKTLFNRFAGDDACADAMEAGGDAIQP